MSERTIAFLAILSTALAMLPAGAHLLALPSKMQMSQEDYYVVQRAYRGWLVATLLSLLAVAANFWLALTVRSNGAALLLAILAIVAVVAAMAVSLLWARPAVRATHNWTVVREDWPVLRNRAETALAVSAALLILALCGSTLAGLTARI